MFFEKGGTTRQTIKTNNRQGPNGTLPPALPLAASRVLHQTPLTFNATISGEWSLEMVQNHFSGLVGCDEGISRVVDIQFHITEVVLNFRFVVFGLESQSLICSKVIPNHDADYGLERLRIAQLIIYIQIHIPKKQKTLPKPSKTWSFQRLTCVAEQRQKPLCKGFRSTLIFLCCA